MGKWSTSSEHPTWSDVWAVCTRRTGCTEGVRNSPCPWSHLRAPVVPGSLLWGGAQSSSGSRCKVRRAASLAQSIAGAGDEERRHTGRVEAAGLARSPASGGSSRQAAHTVDSETCMRPTLRDAAPLPSQWNVSPDIRGGGWALSATNRAYWSSVDMTSSLRLSTSSSTARAAVDDGSACVACAPRHTRYLKFLSK
jgi:hypothetical protein